MRDFVIGQEKRRLMWLIQSSRASTFSLTAAAQIVRVNLVKECCQIVFNFSAWNYIRINVGNAGEFLQQNGSNCDMGKIKHIALHVNY